MKKAAVALITILLGAAGADTSRACVCVCDDTSTFERSVADASVIMVAKVLAIRSRSTDSDPTDDVVTMSSCGQQEIHVAVTQALKGQPEPEVTLVRGSVGTACDFKFALRAGKQYVFFGFRGEDGALYVSGCSPSSPAESARKLLERVRKQLGSL